MSLCYDVIIHYNMFKFKILRLYYAYYIIIILFNKMIVLFYYFIIIKKNKLNNFILFIFNKYIINYI